MESKEKKPKERRDRGLYIKVLQMDLNQLKHEMKITNKRLDHMSCNLRTPTRDLSMETETKEKETKAQDRLALPKSKLHKVQTKVVATEASKVRVYSAKSGTHLALPQSALEVAKPRRSTRD